MFWGVMSAKNFRKKTYLVVRSIAEYDNFSKPYFCDKILKPPEIDSCSWNWHCGASWSTSSRNLAHVPSSQNVVNQVLPPEVVIHVHTPEHQERLLLHNGSITAQHTNVYNENKMAPPYVMPNHMLPSS